MRKDFQILAVAVLGAALLAVVAGCGGGGGAPEPPPPPPTLLITTTTLPDGVVNQAYSQTVAATGGTGARTFSISAGALPPGLSIAPSTGVISGTPGSTGMFNFTVQVVDTGTPQQTDTQALTIDINDDLVITTTSLPDATIGVAYNQTVFATGGTTPYTFTVSSGTLPAGLVINAAGVISGTPTAGATTQNFTVRVADSSSPQDVDTQPLSITITNPSLGRNDTIATATVLANGTAAASISPSGDPNSTFNPDEDFYEITANAGNTVTITVTGPGLAQPSPMDPVIEIVNAAGTRFSTCRDPGDNAVPAPIDQDATPAAFDDQCINDDLDLGVILDSMLEFQVPGAGAVTFFVHVLDFQGSARPDLRYEITVTGAN